MGSHVEHLCQHTFTIDGVVPQVVQRLARSMGQSLRFLFLTLGLGHLGQGNDDEHSQHHETNSHVGVADDSQVMNTDGSLLSLRQRAEDNLSGSIAAVADELGQHDERSHAHAAERTHGIEGLRHIQAAGTGFLGPQRQDKGIGSCLQESQSERQDVKRQTKECEALLSGSRNKEKGTRGI